MKFSVVIRVLVGSFFIVGIVFFSRNGEDKNSGQGTKPTKPTENAEMVPKRHIVINSYKRSGSTFLGQLLGFRPDAFYWYEPLFAYSKWGFLNENSDMCDSRTCRSCVKSPYESSFSTVLKSFFSCDFNNLTSFLRKYVTARRSGPLWNTPECIGGTSDPKRCLEFMEKLCSRKPHLVTKILRSSLDNYKPFLSQSENVVLVQLFRDPRAVINSRSISFWYKHQYKNDTSIVDDVKCLCSRMFLDYKYGLKFKEKYPEKVLFVIYEDLLEDLNNKLNRLYQKLGMATLQELNGRFSDEFRRILPSPEKNYLKLETDGARINYAFWWRSNLSWDIVHTVDTFCGDIYSVIGFNAFKDRADFNNSNVSSINVKNDLRL